LARPLGGGLNFRSISLMLLLVVGSNYLSQHFFKTSVFAIIERVTAPTPSLYLIEEAAENVDDPTQFEAKVREVAERLNVAPEWLMAVMFSESRLDPQAVNLRGSGATGLIQFMPMVAGEMGTTCAAIGKMDAVQQLDLVYRYLQRVRERYGEYESLTDLYLAILYPRAIEGNHTFVLYATPSVYYKQNSGLDENKDGRVTARDIDRRMKRLFPTAYVVEKPVA